MNLPSELDATYYGFVGSTYDALILFEACISGQIKHVSRRPQDRERETIIQSGRIFIYEETTSGIKRWTDGISWSPSRILGNFLIYRQLVKAFKPGEKKKAFKKPKVGSNVSRINEYNSNGRQKENIPIGGILQPTSGTSYGRAGTIDPETERALVGSLTDSYDFLEDGLVKKTISVTCEGVTHHLVSYYTIADVMNQKFFVPSKDPRFQHTRPRPSLLTPQNYRTPIEDMEPLDPSPYSPNIYDLISYGVVQPPGPIMANQENFSNYGGTAVGMYDATYSVPLVATAYETNIPAYTTNIAYPTHYGPAIGIYPAVPHPGQCASNSPPSYVATGSVILDGSHTTMPTASHMQQDPSTSQRKDSGDSGISISMYNKNNDSGYNQGPRGSYGFPRGSFPNQVALDAREALPSSSKPGSGSQISFDKLDLDKTSYHIAGSVDSKDVLHTGNACAGHGHYQQV